MNDIEIPQRNAVVSEPYDLGDGIVVRMMIYENNPRITMILEINENTRFEVISKKRGIIKRFLRDLNKIQGSDLNIRYRQVLLDVSMLHKQNFGYGKISLVLNYFSLVLVYGSFRDLKKKENQPQTKILENENNHNLSPVFFTASGSRLYSLFFAFNYTMDEFNYWVKEAYKMLSDGILPWSLRTGPFTIQKVTDCVRNFESSIAANRISLGERNYKSGLEYSEELIYTRGDFDKVNKLLDADMSHDWKKYRSIILKRVEVIAARVRNSTDPMIVEFREKH